MNSIIKANAFKEIESLYSNLTGNTKKTYISAVNQFMDYMNIGLNEVNKVNAIAMQGYIETLKTKYKSNNTVNLKVSALKSFFRKMRVLYKINNPFDSLKDLGIKTTIQTNKAIDRDLLLTSNDVNKLLRYFENKSNSDNKQTQYTNKRYFVLISLLYRHGLRISEALNIKTNDIKKQTDNIYLISITGKGKKERQIKIDNELYNNLIGLSDNGFIFKTMNDKPLSRIYITSTIKRITKRILNKNISAHIFRHSFASNMLKLTNNIKGVSLYLGHSTTAITLNMYIHNDLTFNDLELLKTA